MASNPEIAAGVSPGPMLPRVCRVRRVTRETHDCFSLSFDEPAPGAIDYAPGQFNMLYVFGVGEIPVSVSSAANNHESLTHTVRAVGTVTKALQRLRKGDEVGIRGPFGNGWPIDEAEGRDVIVVAGGIGLSPLRPAICHMLAHRDRFDRISIVFGTRTPEDIPHQKDLEHWSARLDVGVHVTVDSAAGHWHGDVGVVTELIPRAPLDPKNTLALVCGPEIMMRFSASRLLQQGVPEDHIFLSWERNMRCAIGFCGHCQYGPYFVCRDGPVFRYPQLKPLLRKSEL